MSLPVGRSNKRRRTKLEPKLHRTYVTHNNSSITYVRTYVGELSGRAGNILTSSSRHRISTCGCCDINPLKAFLIPPQWACRSMEKESKWPRNQYNFEMLAWATSSPTLRRRQPNARNCNIGILCSYESERKESNRVHILRHFNIPRDIH